MFGKANLFLMSLIVCGFAGCSSNVAWVYVDNGSDETMTVEVNGEAFAEIAAGESEKLVLPLGEQKIEVKSEGEIVYSQTKNLEPPEEVLTTRRYLLNPDKSKRYWVYQVEYGDNIFEGVVDGLDHRDELTKAHSNLCKDFDLITETGWFDIPSRCHVLRDAPESAAVRRGSSMKIPVLNRVSSENFRTLRNAKKIKKPTEADFESLEKAFISSMALAN